MAEGEAAFLIVGTIQKPHGVKGELFVRLETDRPQTVFTPGRVLRTGDARGRPDGGTLTLERARPFKGGMLVKTAEHGGRGDAQDALRGRSLVIPADEAAPRDDDELFYHQLVGLRVQSADGAAVGVVTDLYEAPGGFLLGVRREDGREVLVPYVRQMVRGVDVAAGTMVLDAPPGLLEL